MASKFKVAIINHSFQVGYFCRRWELFALQHPDVDVYLLAPKSVNGMGVKHTSMISR